jgi:hypothetical protein
MQIFARCIFTAIAIEYFKVDPEKCAKFVAHFQLLPGYSLGLNPIKGLWKWMHQEVTQRHCHDSLYKLFLVCTDFIDSINLNPQQILTRFWPKFDLDPDYEKLSVSN